MEELLLDKPDEDATAPPAKEDPAITALKLEVERLKKVEADRDAERQNARILEADQFVAEAVKNIDVPIVKIARDLIIDGQHIRTGYGLVVETAYQAWMDAGKKGSPQDYVEGAADVVEQWLASKRPELAELAKRPTARTETQTDGEPRPVAAARAIGRRTGARPDAKPTPLPRDKTDRDLQIKKEMGW
jgi:hypothetical protein